MKYINEFLNQHLKIKENEYIIIAVSTGVDSMVLLNLLSLAQSIFNYNICVAHVHHNKRKQSDEELLFISNYCNQRDLTFESLKLPKEYVGNFHDYSHRARYAFFDELSLKYNAKYVFTAHHGDDQVETIMQRLIRGSSFSGYSGIKPISKKHNYYLLRPMLTLSKNEILEYAKENHIEYFEDQSNTSRDYMRNRLRLDVIPKMKEENEQVIEHFNKFSLQVQAYSQYIHKIVNEQYNKVVIDYKINLLLFKELDPFIQKELLMHYLSENLKDDIKYIVDLHINGIYNIINSNKPNVEYYLPMNNKVIKEYDLLYINKNTTDEFEDYIYEFQDLFEFKYGYIKREALRTNEENNNDIIRLYSKEIALPLKVRYRKNGDYIELLGTNGKRKLKDILIDQKVPMSKRNEIPILVDSNDNILWIPSIKKSKYDKKYNQQHDIVLKYYYAK